MGGDPVCWLDRVCPACGALTERPAVAACPRCGALPEGEESGSAHGSTGSLSNS